jgi:dihydrofolate synthase/folylpolyglutamate synthase
MTLITSISLDHTPILGNTLREIAGEKGGIIKPGVPVVLAPQAGEARERLLEIALEKGAPAVEVEKHYPYRLVSQSLSGQVIEVGGAAISPPIQLQFPLVGEHQSANAVTALAALQSADRAGLRIPLSAIQAGFARVSWAGRFEIVQESPLVVLDAAHNPDSAEKLAKTLDQLLPGKKVVLVFGASGDKDVSVFLQHVLPRTRVLIATQSLHPRAMPPGAIRASLPDTEVPVIETETIEQGMNTAFQYAGDDQVILVTGSVFVVGAAREVLGLPIQSNGG